MKKLFTLIALVALTVTICNAQSSWIMVNPATCGGNNGSAYAYLDTAQFGLIGELDYFWSPEPTNGQGTYHVTGLAPGSYTLTVTDAVGNSVQEELVIEAVPGLAIQTPIIDTVWSCATPCVGYTNLY